MPSKHQIGLAWTAIDRLRSVSHHVNEDGSYGNSQLSGPTESSKAWFELTGEQIATAMDRYVPWDGFSAEEKGRVVRNVIADTSEFKKMDVKSWMVGIEAERSDYDRMLDEYAERGKYKAHENDKGIER